MLVPVRLHGSQRAAGGVAVLGGQRAAQNLHFFHRALDRFGRVDGAVVVADGICAVLEVADLAVLQAVDVKALQIARVAKALNIHVRASGRT